MKLIDADKLIKEMSKWYWDKEKQKAAENDVSPMDLFTHLAITTVQEQPTVFDIDKVIKQLEKKGRLHKAMVKYEHKNETIIEEWIIAISYSIVNGIRFMRVSGTVDQIKQILIDLIYNDVTEDEKEFYSGTYDISKIEEEIHNGELYVLNAYNTFSYYQIDYSAQRLSKMQCHKF